MNLIYDEINYMGLLSILELIMVLLKNHSFVILSDLNPLTGEVLESTNIKVNPNMAHKAGCVFPIVSMLSLAEMGPYDQLEDAPSLYLP